MTEQVGATPNDGQILEPYVIGRTTQLSEQEKGKSRRADYEEAISACGYGKFHYFVMLVLIPSCCAQVYSSVTTAYIIPIAECDLKLTNNDKGTLNAGVYIGLTAGAFFGGFASDVFGRRKLIIYGHLAEFIFNVCATFSHAFWLLLLMRICTGFSITGPIASVFSYSAETHNNEKRARVIMFNGAVSALSQGIQPVLAYFLIPLEFRIELIPGVLDFSSWRLFYFICSLPSLLAVLGFFFLPESPKFLMSKGRVDEALEVFKRIYVLNTGKPDYTYPIYDLEIPTEKRPVSSATSPSKGNSGNVIRNGWYQIQPIFRPPYLSTAMVVFAISACTLVAMNSVRLWVPQLFATLEEAKESNTSEVSTMCGLIGSVLKQAPSKSVLAEEGHICPPVSGEVYLRTFVISALAAVSYIITTPIIGLIGRRTFAKLCFPTAAAVAISINWATNKDIFMALLAVYTALIRNCFSVMSTMTVDLFPTAFRSMAMSMTLMCGRIASITGNLLFPIILSISCGAIFFSLGGILLLASALVWFVSNKTEKL